MQTVTELIESLRDWKKLTRSEILLTLSKIQDATLFEQRTINATRHEAKPIEERQGELL